MGTLDLTRMLSYLVVSVSSLVLLYFILVYVQIIFANTYHHGWRLLGIGTGAGFLYGTSGILYEYTGVTELAIFRQGASLFFILFLALGIRAISQLESRGDDGSTPPYLNYVFDGIVVTVFVLAWWISFVLEQPSWIIQVQVTGWVLMVCFAIYYAVKAVYKHEGTSIAAIVRHLLPAVVCFAGIIIVELLHLATDGFEALAGASWIVGVVLVSVFLFNTATTIRQEKAELHRIYDRTTWRGND